MTSFNINKCVKGAWDDEHNEQIKWDKALRKAKQHPNFGKILMSPTEYCREDTEDTEETTQG